MKISLSLILATIIFGYSLGVSAAPVCDQTFEGTLRVGFGYTFGDMYTNPDAFRHNIAGGNVTIDESVSGDLNRAAGPGFTWTPQLVSQDYEVAPGQTIQALSADTPYYVYDYPMSRDNKLRVVYSLDVQGQNSDGSWTHPPVNYNECKSYTITRCGDGVVDPGYETCDPAAPGQSPYTCDAVTCQPIVQQPTCDKIRVYPKSGDVPLAVDVSCDTTNETSVSIACGNGQTINGKTGTCNYATVGTFYPVCTVNGSITSPACQTTVKVKKPAPDISIKKYAKEISASGDTQSAPISIARGEAFNYYYQLQNTGAVAATYVVVKDTLPAYLTFSSQVTVKNQAGIDVTSDWACTQGSQIFSGETIPRITLVCTKATPLPAYSGIYTFTVPVVLATGAPVGINMQNVVYACADNMVGNPTGPNGEVICGNPNPPPPPPPNQCTPTNNPQKDPACIVVPSPTCTVNCGGGSSTTYYIQNCVNSINACAAQSHGSLAICQAANPGKICHTDINLCNAVPALTCSGPGGPTPGGSGNPTGYCGDGVLRSSPNEECDLGNANSDAIGSMCSSTCQVRLLTTPGANPITDLWMTIPVLAGTQHLGYTWLDGTPGKVAFSDNRMVLGVGTKAFTLADTVGFGIKTQFRIPMIIAADKQICLKSSGVSLNSQTICTTFGAEAPASMIWTRPIDGKKYVVVGQGDFQYQNTLGGPYYRKSINSSNNVVLFRGPTSYRPSLSATNVGPTLNSAFFGSAIGTDGTIGLVTDIGVMLVDLPVRVSGAKVASVGSASNRAIEQFVNTHDVFAEFLGTTFLAGISRTTSTTTSNNVGNVAVNMPTIVGTVANPTISSVTELEQYAVNGNKNILAVTGDLTITCPTTGPNVFTMNGVRAVIVTGNLIIRCNIVYGSSDSTSSWAWIAKNGNIQVSNGAGTTSVGAVTNLAGVYVAVKETTGGDITYVGNTTTQAILRVEGTLYGNATPLFQSRLYARATGAYDILTTGTILTYSNRALVSPPPLLSQYLGTYQVQRVVQ